MQRQQRPINQGVKMPNSFRCDIGGEWKPLNAFSKRYQRKIEGKTRIDPAKTGMICREHSGEPVTEMRCEGACDKVKPLKDFSKNTRANGLNVCIKCQYWLETLEPTLTPVAAPLHISDTGEQERIPIIHNGPDAQEQMFEFDDDRPLAPVTGTDGITVPFDDGSVAMRNLSITASPLLNSSSTSGNGKKHMYPPHLVNVFTPGTDVSGSGPPHGDKSRADKFSSDPSNSRNMLARARENEALVSFNDTTVSGANNAVNDSQGGSARSRNGWDGKSISTATTMRKQMQERSAKKEMAFNVWDAQGNPHTRTKAPSERSQLSTQLSTHSAASSGSQALTKKAFPHRGAWGGSQDVAKLPFHLSVHWRGEPEVPVPGTRGPGSDSGSEDEL